MKEITYISDQAKEYQEELVAAATLPKLLAVLESYHSIAPDAFDAAPRDATEFEEFRRGLLAEKRREFSGEEWMQRYGAILLPALMLRVAMIANRFGAPFGAAFMRCVEVGAIEFQPNGIAVWKGKA